MDLASPSIVGVVLAVAVFVLARTAGLDRDRAFYPTVLIVIASTYLLFAVLGGSTRALVLESLVFCILLAAAVLGFKGSLWIVVVGLMGHGVMDSFHGHLIENPGVPSWWPMFCLSYDIVAGACLAWLLRRSSIRSRPA